jgi:hypothetical protein
MLKLAVPSFVIVTVRVSEPPTATFSKSSEAGETEIATVPELLFPPPTAPLPVTPTQPEVIKIAAKVSVANAPRIIDVDENLVEPRDSLAAA